MVATGRSAAWALTQQEGIELLVWLLGFVKGWCHKAAQKASRGWRRILRSQAEAWWRKDQQQGEDRNPARLRHSIRFHFWGLVLLLKQTKPWFWLCSFVFLFLEMYCFTKWCRKLPNTWLTTRPSQAISFLLKAFLCMGSSQLSVDQWTLL